MLSRFFPSNASDADGADLSPTRMKGREPVFGYAVAAVIIVVGALDLLIRTGSGAVAHPTLWTAGIGVLIGVALMPAVWHGSRMIAPFVAIFGAFFVTLSKAPDVLEIPHMATLLAAVAFALIVSLHQRRDQKALMPTAADRRAAGDARRRRRKGEPEPVPAKSRPHANRRYTPPKPTKNPRR